MQLVVQSPTRPERIISALDDMIDEDTTAIRLAVAYVTLSGTNLLIERMMQKLGEENWEKVDKKIITCFDFGFTEPKALEKWVSQPRSVVFAQNADLISERNFRPKTAFHAKMYDIRSKNHSNLMVGSANLSERALTSNSEVATIHRGITKLKTLSNNWERLRIGSTAVDAALIAAYDAARIAAPPTPPPPIPPPTAAPTQALYDALQEGSCDPSIYEYFWVDAGYLSGGSFNQLELPRGANTYFGFSFDDYGSIQESIGSVKLAVRSAFHEDRLLSWHGDNRMERINLPTDESYAGNVMLFRRLANHFELTWAPTGSQRVVAWASASEVAQRRYRVGQKSTRTCGLF